MSHEPNAVWSKDTESLELPELTIIARSMIAARKAIRGPLPAELIHDPAVDLLLHLFVAEIEHRRVSSADALAMTTVHDTGVMRWVRVLESYGLVEQHDDAVMLSAGGRESVCEMLRVVARSQWQFSEHA